MFVQVIEGKVGDEQRLRQLMDRWNEELRPGADGYLGTTAGITDDGSFVALARFESPESARANSERSEQGEWWSEVEQCFDGSVTFMDCDDAKMWLSGGSDDASFVQIMQGRSSDVARMHDLMSRHDTELREGRPEIIGGLLMDIGDGQYVDAIYFTDEGAAREGEKLDPPEEVRADMEEGMKLMGEVTYFDLRDPILVSA